MKLKQSVESVLGVFDTVASKGAWAAAGLVLAAALVAPVQANPAGSQIQTCSIMEVTYVNEQSMSYRLPCTAGQWSLLYTGSIPSGLGRTSAHYRVEVVHPNGMSFALNRSMVISSPAHLGQALQREAILLKNGDIAMANCKSAGCSSYRPLGALKRLEKEYPAQFGIEPKKPQKPLSQPMPTPVEEQPAQSLTPATMTMTAQTREILAQNERLSIEVQVLGQDLARAQQKVQAQQAQIQQLSAQIVALQSQLNAPVSTFTGEAPSAFDIEPVRYREPVVTDLGPPSVVVTEAKTAPVTKIDVQVVSDTQAQTVSAQQPESGVRVGHSALVTRYGTNVATMSGEPLPATPDEVEMIEVGDQVLMMRTYRMN